MKMKSKLIAIIAAILAVSTPSIAQKAKTVLNSEINSNFPDQNTGAITPALARTTFNDFVASWQQAPLVNAQVGTTYTFLATDYGKIVTFNNAGAIAVTLPNPSGSFNPWNVIAVNLGTGTVTITPTGSTINGNATQTVLQGGFQFLSSDGSGNNYAALGVPTSVSCALFPALTGVITTSAGSCTTAFSSTAISTLGFSGVNLAARFGSMDVWQRGAGGSASIAVGASTTAYTVDGCYLITGANQAHVVAAVAGIATGSSKAAAITRNSGQTGTGGMAFGCPFDSDEIALFAGSFVTLSFTASTGANWSQVGAIAADLVCGTGSPKKQSTGYTNQTIPISIAPTIAAGSSATRYQGTSAAIVPANCTQAEFAIFWNPVGTAGAADTITIDDVQLEVVLNSASIATPYQRQDFDYQLNKAQRHFTKTFAYGTAPAQNAGFPGALSAIISVVGQSYTMGWRYPRQMRVAPSVTTFNPNAALANCAELGTSPTNQATTVNQDSNASGDAVSITCIATGSTLANRLYIQVSADAGI